MVCGGDVAVRAEGRRNWALRITCRGTGSVLLSEGTEGREGPSLETCVCDRKGKEVTELCHYLHT